MHLFPFVDITTGTYTAPVCCLFQLLGRQIYYKLSAVFQKIVRISFRSYRYIQHRRIRTYCSCPRNCYDIRSAGFICSTYHHSRKRIQHIPRFPDLLCHVFSPASFTAVIHLPKSVSAVSFWIPHPLRSSSPCFLSGQMHQ